jgi:hypothetical protein
MASFFVVTHLNYVEYGAFFTDYDMRSELCMGM